MTPKEAYDALAKNLLIVGERELSLQLSPHLSRQLLGTEASELASKGSRVGLPAELLRHAIRTANKYEGSDLLAAAKAVETNLAKIAQMMFPVHDSETHVVAYLYRG